MAKIGVDVTKTQLERACVLCEDISTTYPEIGIGRKSATDANTNAIAIGKNTVATGGNSIALGRGANVSGDNSIQIGAGRNVDDDTVKIKDTTILDEDGKIPFSAFKDSVIAGTGVTIVDNADGTGTINATGGGGGGGTVDTAMSDSSTNAVQNKVIKTYVDTEDAKKLDIAQGSENEGKILKINSSGNVTTGDMLTACNFVGVLPQSGDVNTLYLVPSALPSIAVELLNKAYEHWGDLSNYSKFAIFTRNNSPWLILIQSGVFRLRGTVSGGTFLSPSGLVVVKENNNYTYYNVDYLAHDYSSVDYYNTPLYNEDYTFQVAANCSDEIDYSTGVPFSYEYQGYIYDGSNFIQTKLSKYRELIEQTIVPIINDKIKNKVNTSAIKQTTGSGTTDLMSQKAVSDALAEKADKNKYFTNISVATTDWLDNATTPDTGFEDYDYKAVITCQGVTADMYANIIYYDAQSKSGNYSITGATGTNSVTVYSNDNSAITIPTIIVGTPSIVNVTQGESLHNYSTTEQIVGTWIDGKPVYEILLPCSVTGNMKNTGGAEIEDISLWVGDYSSLNVGRVIDLNIITENGCLYKPCCMSDNGVIKIRLENYAWNGNETATHFLIRYTKTTDTAEVTV